MPYTDTNIIEKFDDFIDNNKTRFILVSTTDYNKERLPRKIRNKYKVYLIHYGNYLETLDMKAWRKNIQSSPIISIYPQITQAMIDTPELYQLHL